MGYPTVSELNALDAKAFADAAPDQQPDAE